MTTTLMTSSTPTTAARELSAAMSKASIPAVIEFSTVFSEASRTAQTPAGLTETVLPDVCNTSWLITTSNALIGATENQTLRMVLERALPQGVAIAVDVDWQPEAWGLPAGSPPSPEVLRRFQPLAQAASLIRCSRTEAEVFFGDRDPLQVHNALSQRPGVVITDCDGSVDWCLGGRRGTMGTLMVKDQESFFTALIENLAEHPALLGQAKPGRDAVADPDGLTEALLSAASR